MAPPEHRSIAVTCNQPTPFFLNIMKKHYNPVSIAVQAADNNTPIHRIMTICTFSSNRD